MNNLLGHTVVHGVDATNNDVLSFCSWTHCHEFLETYPLHAILSGITSPFGYFSPQILLDHSGNVAHILGDATYTMKNPALRTYVAGERLCPHAKQYLLVSLGTGHLSNIAVKTIKTKHWGRIHWLMYVFADMYFGSSNQIKELLSDFSNRFNHGHRLIYVRINPRFPIDMQDPFEHSKKKHEEILQVSQQFYKKNQPVFQCIDEILITRQITLQCQKTLTEYQHLQFQNANKEE